MMDELSWSDAVYGAGAGIFFIGYFFFEVPSNLLLAKIGAPKTIMRIGLGWGAVTLLMAFVTEPWHFYVLRFLQGAFEAGLHPGLILYVTFWPPAHRRAKAIAGTDVGLSHRAAHRWTTGRVHRMTSDARRIERLRMAMAVPHRRRAGDHTGCPDAAVHDRPTG